MFRRILALLLCLLLLPVAAMAEAAEGFRFRLTFDMDESAYPAEVQDVLPGIADLANILTLEGVFAEKDGHFDLQADILLNGQERTRTDVHLFGSESHWNVRSSLLGDETLTIVMVSLLEFAIKGYSHLGIPIQRALILVSPYVHLSGLNAIVKAAHPLLFSSDRGRVITRDTMIKAANAVAAATENDRAFRYWTDALFMETGYDGYAQGLPAQFPEWVRGFVPSDGVKVQVSENAQVWTAGKLTLAQWETDLSGAQTLSITLPPLPDGLTVTFDAATQPDGDLTHGSFNLLALQADGSVFLRLHADGSLPNVLPVSRGFSLTWEAEGLAVGGDGVHLIFEGEPTDQGLVVRQLDPVTGAVMLTVNAELERASANVEAIGHAGGVEILSVNGDSLGDLMERIFSPLARGLLPVIAQAPASSCQTLMDLFEKSGVFALLTDGLSDGDGWGEEWDEEDW